MLGSAPLGSTPLASILTSGGASTTFLVADAASFILTGRAALFVLVQVTGAGSFTFTGVSASLYPAIIGTAGAFTLTGRAVLFSINWVESAGAFTFTGRDATLTPSILANAGTYVLSGMSALLLPGLEPGAFIFTGNDAALTPLIIPTTRRPLLRRGAGTFWRGVS